MNPVTIVGGGLAGLSLGIRLRLACVPTTVREAGSYPRHRVCGELISGRGLDILRRSDVLGDWVGEETLPACSVALFDGDRLAAARTLPEPAACVARYRLDARLAKRFVDLGGTLITGSPTTETTARAGFVHATGRRRHTGEPDCHWFGVKMHVRDPGLEADLELHFFDHAYIGLCRVDRETANVCGLVRRSAGEPLPIDTRRPERLLWGSPGGNLHARLSLVRPAGGSLTTVAGLAYAPPLKECDGILRLGDCRAVIPPFTGNGMSMAIESGWDASPALEAYSNSECSWEETLRTVSRANDQSFTARLRWSRLLHRALWHPAARRCLLDLAAASPLLWRTTFRLTR